jgi:hypothetical protein
MTSMLSDPVDAITTSRARPWLARLSIDPLTAMGPDPVADLQPPGTRSDPYAIAVDDPDRGVSASRAKASSRGESPISN